MDSITYQSPKPVHVQYISTIIACSDKHATGIGHSILHIRAYAIARRCRPSFSAAVVCDDSTCPQIPRAEEGQWHQPSCSSSRPA